jgi:hypothetical protein
MTFTKVPKTTQQKHGAPVITALKKTTRTGLTFLKQAAAGVPKTQGDPAIIRKHNKN